MATRKAKTTGKDVRAARAELYRAAILEAAERVFAEQGYEASRMQTVAAEAGVALGTLYKVFAGKQDVLDAIHRQQGEKLIHAATSHADLAGGPLEAVLSGTDAYMRYLAAHPNYLKIHLAGGHAWALGSGYISPEQVRQFDTGLQIIALFLTRAMDAGVMVREDPLLSARLMIAAHQVMLADYVDRGDGDVEGLVARVRAYMLRAFAP
ncbi:MAG: TetR/AcrR family transcriptional regulator [Myxococcales bacterium]|nr:TetR/AcrR family transcriptional regulator [Myxococcales bacterium]MCB9625858.1 TetR/AcrR family transcriptional regulator [Sandaracinaceae bacterium]